MDWPARSPCELSFLLLLSLFFPLCRPFILDGSPTSFAQFPRWQAGLNGSLALSFRTREPNGLLLYTDDGGAYDFFEVKLVEGNVRLRFNLGGGTAILAAGKNLHDSQWHKLKITRNAEETILAVDLDVQKRLTAGPDYMFGNTTTNSAVFVGGLPEWYGSKLSLLALPSAYFEPRFQGSVQDMVFASDDGIQKAQELQESQGIRTASLQPGAGGDAAPDDHCERENPCLNTGACISTDGGPICDCRATDYEGDLCEQKRPPSEATFTGEEYLHFDVRGSGGEPLVSWSDQLSLQFRSRQSAGLLFFAADFGQHAPSGNEDFLHVSLKGGGVAVHTKLGSGHVEKIVRPSKVRFDDNQWHKIVIHRKVREITRATGFCHLSVTIDGVYTERGSTAGSFSMLSSSVIYVGGTAPNTAAQLMPASRVRNNFIGCVRKVEFVADSVSLDLLSLAKSQSKLLRYHGDVQFFCQEMEAADPITFTTRESFLALPTWEGSKTGSIAFRFRTNEATGLLMYNGGQGDVFALELLDGHVYLILGMGSGIAKVKASAKRCDDGQWHTVTLRRTGKTGRIAVDEAAYDFTTPGTASQLDLEGPLFVGALAPSDQGPGVPSEVWTAKLNYGYVGCLRQLVVNGKTVDLAAQAREQDSGSLRPSCHTSPSQCDSQPCLNGGLCSEGWNRFVCDCTRTGFTGPVCAKDASTLSFDGSQYLQINIPEGSRTQAEDVQLRFRTPRPGGLLLATTASEKAEGSYLVVGLEGGKLKIVINLGDKDKVIDLGQSLNDDTWHTVHIRRRGHKMDVHLDSDSKSYDLGEVDSMTLDIQTLHVGSVHPEHLKPPVPGMSNYVGHLQHLIFNRKHYLDMVHSGQIAHFKVTAKFGKKDNIVHHPVTFKSKFTFLGLPQLRAYSTLNLYFQFKTMEPNGLLLYNGGKGQDFVAVELVDGHLHYVFNLGDGPRGVRSNTKATLNDNQWHAVTIGRPSPHQHTLMVDDMITKVSSPGPNTHLDLQGLLYVGGVRRSMFASLPRLLHSRQGFQGCLASLDLNGETGDLVRDALIPSTLVARGCAGPITKCSHSACANHGVCVQMWNSYACDCDMTSFSGPICADESISYEFGPGTGLVTFTFPSDKMPDTKADLVALGFITMADNGVLARIDSGTSNDYMELEIVDGNIYMVYNMGTEDHPIGEHSVHVNDGQYHVVRFTRSGPNSTIQVDDHNVRVKQPPGRQLTVFNSHSTVQVGGKKNPLRGGIERPFQGIISGLVVNGDRILDMAAEDDPRISVQGDVELLMSLPLSLQQRSVPSDHQMQQHAGASPQYGGDDLVYSGGGGSGCWDDEDDCGESDSSTGRKRDDLITPVYIPPTPRPYPRTTPSISGGGGPVGQNFVHGRSSAPPRHAGAGGGGLEDTTCDDEEDCAEGGSGLGEVTFTLNTPATPPAFITTTSSHQDISENYVNPPGVLPPPTHEMNIVQRIVVTPPTIPISTTVYRRPPPEEVIVTHHRPPGPPPPPLYPVIPQQTPRPPFRTTSRAPPSVYGVPIPDLPVTGRESNKPPPKVKTSSAADNTAMVIGIIAGVLIVVVIVALVVYRVRSWTLAASPGAGGYKVDETAKRYHFPPAGTAPYQSQPPSAQHMNGALKCDPNAPQNKLMKQPKKKDVKDLKEWYV